MTRRRLHRLTTALCVVMSLLFAQLALAGYVCPNSVPTATMAQRMSAGEPCEGKNPAQPALCHQHSAAASQSVEIVKVPAPSSPALLQVLVLPAVVDTADASAVPAVAAPRDRTPPGRVFLSTLRLRV